MYLSTWKRSRPKPCRKLHRSKAFVVLIRNNSNGNNNIPEVLIVRESYNELGFPGGTYDKRDKSHLVCAKREFAEEIGVEVPPINFLELTKYRYKYITMNIFATVLSDDIAKTIPTFSRNYGELHGSYWIPITKLLSTTYINKFRPIFKYWMHGLVAVIHLALLTDHLNKLNDI